MVGFCVHGNEPLSRRIALLGEELQTPERAVFRGVKQTDVEENINKTGNVRIT